MQRVAGRFGAAVGMVTLMAGCATPPPPWSASMLTLPQQQAAHPPSAYFDFSWVLSGDRLAAPLQVFDDGRHMWLQFSPSQGIPQLLGHTPQGWMALDYAVQGAYVVLNSVWQQLQVKAGGLEALVERQDTEPVRQESAATPHQSAPPAL